MMMIIAILLWYERIPGSILFHQVRTLIPKIERLIHNNGMESELLVLAGTVAINYQGRQYNIPVEIYVSEPYPDAPPRCYVRPTKDMDIKLGHRHVDREVGREDLLFMLLLPLPSS